MFHTLEYKNFCPYTIDLMPIERRVAFTAAEWLDVVFDDRLPSEGYETGEKHTVLSRSAAVHRTAPESVELAQGDGKFVSSLGRSGYGWLVQRGT